MKNKGAWKWEYSNKQWFYTILYALTHCYDCFITGSKYEYNFRKYLSPLWNILLLNKKSIQIHLFSYCIKCISKLLLWECDYVPCPLPWPVWCLELVCIWQFTHYNKHIYTRKQYSEKKVYISFLIFYANFSSLSLLSLNWSF